MKSAPEFRGNTPRHLEDLNVWTRRRSEDPLEPGLPIVDPHHHLWDSDHGRYLLPDFLSDLDTGHNIVATVYLQATAMYRQNGPSALQSVGEVEFANGVAAMSASGRYGKTRVCEGIVGFADLLLGNEAEPVLEALIQAGNGRLRGIRHGMTWDAGAAGYGRTFPPRHTLLNETFRQGFSLLARHGLTFDAWLFYHQLPELMDLLTAFPDTQVVLNHAGGLLGIPPHVDRPHVFSTWTDHIRKLACFPNLSIKLGGLGMLYCGWDFHVHGDPPTSADLARAWRPYVETCIEAFGPERCMFESNFPVDKQSCGYGQLWNAFKRITQSYSPTEKAALYHDTAARFYRLGTHT
ncbi:amidohydrolase family protein [Cupriavidus pinatubonensis]|uniref:amidohydrolase family protein n=1 Tax=Cupriavidus pinatubonensis TaxID=248026 RepID=UPI00112908AF|nr:amidohydrolase family protein [Cupriavidus pinatubonensis]TPQ26627.1 amidohydrolase [Cupriavidus pinatubonensis]